MAARTTRLTSFPGTTISLTTLAVEVALDVLALPGEPQKLLLGRARVGLDPVPELAVHLNHQHEGVPLEQLLVGLRPGLLPDPLPGQPLVDLRAQMGREGEEQRGRGRGREADRGAPVGSS